MHPRFDIVPDKKIAYLIARKCGCSSIRHAFAKIRSFTKAATTQDEIHLSHDSFQRKPSELGDPRQWFKFTLARDPVRRFMSFYSGKILDQNLNGNHTFVEYRRFGLLPNMSVDKVIDVLFDRYYETEPHLVPQSENLDSIGFELDYIGRLEQLEQSVQQIKQKSGVALELDHLNRSRQIQLIPSKTQFERLCLFYRSDFERFGYSVDFAEWKEQNIADKKLEFRQVPGFTFENEARLLHHDIQKDAQGFLIRMLWRTAPGHQRHRVVRIVKRLSARGEAECFWHDRRKLVAEQADGLCEDQVLIPFSSLPAESDLQKIYQELFFWDRRLGRSPLTDYASHDNMLLFSLQNHRRGREAA